MNNYMKVAHYGRFIKAAYDFLPKGLKKSNRTQTGIWTDSWFSGGHYRNLILILFDFMPAAQSSGG